MILFDCSFFFPEFFVHLITFSQGQEIHGSYSTSKSPSQVNELPNDSFGAVGKLISIYMIPIPTGTGTMDFLAENKSRIFCWWKPPFLHEENRVYTLGETNIAPANGWLED